jgi:hypothetical protein
MAFPDDPPAASAPPHGPGGAPGAPVPRRAG